MTFRRYNTCIAHFYTAANIFRPAACLTKEHLLDKYNEKYIDSTWLADSAMKSNCCMKHDEEMYEYNIYIYLHQWRLRYRTSEKIKTENWIFYDSFEEKQWRIQNVLKRGRIPWRTIGKMYPDCPAWCRILRCVLICISFGKYVELVTGFCRFYDILSGYRYSCLLYFQVIAIKRSCLSFINRTTNKNYHNYLLHCFFFFFCIPRN